MKTKIQLKNLLGELLAPVEEILDEVNLELDASGVKVLVEEGDAIMLTKTADGVTLTYSRTCELFRALSMLADFIAGDATELVQKSHADLLSYMADMSRNAVYNIPTAKQMIRKLALCGYNSLMLYTEDTYEMTEYPYFGYMRGRFTKAELKELDDYADSFGIELIPCIQTLAHLNAALQWQAHRPMVSISTRITQIKRLITFSSEFCLEFLVTHSKHPTQFGIEAAAQVCEQIAVGGFIHQPICSPPFFSIFRIAPFSSLGSDRRFTSILAVTSSRTSSKFSIASGSG
jgi:hypothetical protein